MTEPKYNWIAQDENGAVHKFIDKPIKSCGEWVETASQYYIGKKTIKSWKKRCFDLNKFDYEIINEKLIGIPKNVPDWLMKIKEIDIKAFDWITRRKDIEEICKEAYFGYAFRWEHTKQGTFYWLSIKDKIDAMNNKTK